MQGYPQSACVVFQLMLDSFLLLYRESLSIQKLLTKLSKEEPVQTKSNKRYQYLIKELVQLLQHEVAPSTELPFADSTLHHGHLNRLHKDCMTLAQTASCEETALFYELVCKAWLEAQQALQAHLHAKNSSNNWEPFLTQVQKLLRTIERIAKYWPKLFDAIPPDENVLLFLVTRRHEVDTLYGKGFTSTLLKKFSPDGRGALRRFMVEAYLTRGFDDLIPSIDEAVEELTHW